MITEKEISVRNNLILSFFSELGWDITVFGNPNTPAIILSEKIILNCYVKNFHIIFTNAPKQGEELFRYRLTSGSYDFSEQQRTLINEWLNNYTHKHCYAIQVVGTKLKLAGYNFDDFERKETRYPVFAAKNYKIYFEADYAQGIINTYANEELPLELV